MSTIKALVTCRQKIGLYENGGEKAVGEMMAGEGVPLSLTSAF